MGQPYAGTSKAKPYAGTSKVKAIYRGTTKIWSNGGPILLVNDTNKLYGIESTDNLNAGVEKSTIDSDATSRITLFAIRKSDGRIVAVASTSSGTTIFTSKVNDFTWIRADKFYTSITGDYFQTSCPTSVSGIYVLNNKFYAIGTTNFIMQSDDGVSWRTVNVQGSITEGRIYSICFHKGKYFSTRQSPYLKYSLSPDNWSSMGDTEQTVSSCDTLRSNGNYLFAFGNQGWGSMGRSLDGVTGWTSTHIDRLASSVPLVETYEKNIAIGYQSCGVIAYSKDEGVTWGYRVFPEISTNQYNCRGITCVGDTFVFAYHSAHVASPQYLIKTNDFINWTFVDVTATVNRVWNIKNVEGE
jgi:hypothetical protein|nr:MAG TPA: Photosynthesis system II assembly factor YCF48 [Caudoviricetes sp.]